MKHYITRREKALIVFLILCGLALLVGTYLVTTNTRETFGGSSEVSP